jgi:hypothetical protein
VKKLSAVAQVARLNSSNEHCFTLATISKSPHVSRFTAFAAMRHGRDAGNPFPALLIERCHGHNVTDILRVLESRNSGEANQ